MAPAARRRELRLLLRVARVGGELPLEPSAPVLDEVRVRLIPLSVRRRPDILAGAVARAAAILPADCRPTGKSE